MNDIKRAIDTIEFIEENLIKNLDLSSIAKAVYLSPYHLHRTFSMTTGMTIHNYVRRRQLTEAAKMLSFSDKSILEIAFSTGYETQQSFSKIFKSMYKYSPNSYRKNGLFYPLQQRFEFHNEGNALFHERRENLHWQVKLAKKDDLTAWINLVRLVVDGYPFLDEAEHLKVVRKYIDKKQAFIVIDNNIVIGNMLLSYETGSIDFLGVHPFYRSRGLFEILLKNALFKFFNEKKTISITTFRENDKADLGYRKIFKAFGFVESELLIEFGYPTQKFLFHKDR